MYKFIAITREKVYNWLHYNDPYYEGLFHAYIKVREQDWDSEAMRYPDLPAKTHVKRKRLLVEIDFPDTGDDTKPILALKDVCATTTRPDTPPPENQECLINQM